MDNEIIYVVVCRGEYGDFSHDLIASFDQERCKAYIVERKAADLLQNKRYEAVKSFTKRWNDANPSPPLPKFLDRPKWKPGLRKEEITEEMRAKRDEVDAKNSQINNEYGALYDAYYDKQSEAVRNFIRETLRITDEKLIEEIRDYSYVDECEYYIKELKFLP